MADQLLLVDAEPAVRAALQDYLQSQGYAVEVAVDAASALRAVRRSRPALIILDFQLPDRDGFQVARALRSLGQSIPILMTSTTYFDEAQQAAAREELQIEALLSKPLDLSELSRSVRLLLESRPAMSPIRGAPEPSIVAGLPIAGTPISGTAVAGLPLEAPATQVNPPGLGDGPVLAEDLSGELEQRSVCLLLAAAYHQRRTGMLDLTDPSGIHRRIYVRAGQPIFMQSNAVGEHVGRVLLGRGRINERDVERCTRLMQQRQRTIQQALLELRLVSEQELATAYRLLAKELLPRSLGMRQGSFHWQESDAFVGRVPEGKFDALPLLFDGIRRWVSPPQIAAYLRDKLDCRLLPGPALAPLSSLFSRSFPSELDWAELQGGMTPRRLSEEVSDLVGLMTQLYALLNTQLLFAGPLDATGAQRSGPGMIELPRSPSQDIHPTEASAMVAHRLDKARPQDFFQLLGLGRDASSRAVTRAYFQKVLRWPPPSMAGLRADPDFAPQLAELDARLDEAVETLMSEASREAYQRFLARSGGQNPKAQELYLRARSYAQERAWTDAQRALSEALQLERAGPYLALFGWALFQQKPSSSSAAARAVQHLKEALAQQEDLPDAHYYLGEIAQAHGQPEQARKWWYRCLSADPVHRAAREALLQLDAVRTQETEVPTPRRPGGLGQRDAAGLQARELRRLYPQQAIL